MKERSTIVSFILFIILFFPGSAISQQIILILKPPDPGKLNIADFWSFTLINTTNNSMEVYLKGTAVEKVDGLIASGKTANILLNPKETKNMKVSDFPETPEVKYHSDKERYKESLIRLGKFPSGIYTICIGVYQVKEKKETVDECQTYEVFSGILDLISPDDKKEIEVAKQILFTWTPLQEEKNYSIRIVELRKGQSIIDAIKTNKVFFEKKGIMQNLFQYPMTERDFDTSKIYAWQVTANQSNVKAKCGVLSSAIRISGRTPAIPPLFC
jgi:hypothetical protein